MNQLSFNFKWVLTVMVIVLAMAFVGLSGRGARVLETTPGFIGLVAGIIIMGWAVYKLTRSTTREDQNG